MITDDYSSPGVYVSFGSNLGFGTLSPLQTIERAVELLSLGGDKVIAMSSAWTSFSWPPDQIAPNYVNLVCEILPQDNSPTQLLNRLHAIENKLGRSRDPQNQYAARTMDLDLLDYNSLILENDSFLTLPHPRIGERDFVLKPLLEINMQWIHPKSAITGKKLLELLIGSGRENGCQRLVC